MQGVIFKVAVLWHAVSDKNHLVSGRPENFSGRPERSQVDLRLTASGGTPHSLAEVSGNKRNFKPNPHMAD